ncbi:hypothetical protein [Planctobacterium marinum]|uniref:hypothetical protein n=1 Tax=Planctobacterium marinum TaxID=1631968 RepID=UPI001E41C20E|nr:hypothetical protein [Planctobacterium marinum]MCC2604047.1 hypothetical protein [Planctobacterium marinum]
MTESELVSVVFQIRDQINFLWNFYVTACAVLIGWIYSDNMSWNKDKYLAISGLFFVFALINVLAVHKEYGLLALALSDLINNASVSGKFVPALAQSGGLGAMGATLVHLLVDVLLLLLIRHRFNKKLIRV